METNHPINELMAETIRKVKETVDANTVVGDPIVCGEVTLIPVSRLSVGFGTGGTEFGKKPENGAYPFGGGGGAGVKLTPVCFLAVSGTDVRVLPVDRPCQDGVGMLIEMVPELMGKVSGLLKKDNGGENPTV